MSVDQTHYVMLGIKTKYPKYENDEDQDEAYEAIRPYEDNGYQSKVTVHNGLTVVTDGMCGEYRVVGKVLAKSKGYQGIDMTDCSFDPTKAEKIAKLAKEHLKICGRVKVWAFTHFH